MSNITINKTINEPPNPKANIRATCKGSCKVILQATINKELVMFKCAAMRALA